MSPSSSIAQLPAVSINKNTRMTSSPTNTTSCPRVAVCLSGALRTFLGAWPTFIKHVAHESCVFEYFAHFNWDPVTDVEAARAIYPTIEAVDEATQSGALHFLSDETRLAFRDAVAQSQNQSSSPSEGEHIDDATVPSAEGFFCGKSSSSSKMVVNTDDDTSKKDEERPSISTNTTSTRRRPGCLKRCLVSTNDETIASMFRKSKKELSALQEVKQEDVILDAADSVLRIPVSGTPFTAPKKTKTAASIDFISNLEAISKLPTAKGMIPLRIMAMAESMELAQEQLNQYLEEQVVENQSLENDHENGQYDLYIRTRPDLFWKADLDLRKAGILLVDHHSDTTSADNKDKDIFTTIFLPWYSYLEKEGHGLAWDQFAVSDSLYGIRLYNSFRKHLLVEFERLNRESDSTAEVDEDVGIEDTSASELKKCKDVEDAACDVPAAQGINRSSRRWTAEEKKNASTREQVSSPAKCLTSAGSTPDMITLGEQIAAKRKGKQLSRVDLEFYPERQLYDLLKSKTAQQVNLRILPDYHATVLRKDEEGNYFEADPFGKLRHHFPAFKYPSVDKDTIRGVPGGAAVR
ncbi:unnamed protein product [Amoebophrya sp. A25]|nr:unnamed protein product [Amoebophrya sp. A25]|eukprot:GSA25T00026235001.1